MPHSTAGLEKHILCRKVRYQKLLNWFACVDENKPRDVRFEVFTAVTMKYVVLWDTKPSSYFTGDTLHLHYRDQPVYDM
jgi:hypothetical protein